VTDGRHPSWSKIVPESTAHKGRWWKEVFASTADAAEGIELIASRGEATALTAATCDPDVVNVSVKLWQHDEADTYWGMQEPLTVGDNEWNFVVPEGACIV